LAHSIIAVDVAILLGSPAISMTCGRFIPRKHVALVAQNSSLFSTFPFGYPLLRATSCATR
jgi:hypothetical protein